MCTQSPSKRTINKAPHIVPLLEEYAENIIIYVNVVNHAPHGCHVLLFVINYIKIIN
jgi:hypothetical protein